MKKILNISFLCSLVTLAQTAPTQNQNYVHTTSYQQPYTQFEVENNAIPDIYKIESVTYYDGLGRNLQSNSVRASGSGLDIITPFLYDGLGRQSKQYLPFPKTGSAGGFETGPIPLQESFYLAAYPDDIYGTSPLNTFSETRYEESPLNRVQEQGAPGNDWKIDPILDTDHTIKYSYATNGSVLHFLVTFNGGNTESPALELSSSTYWPLSSLYSTHMRDENWDPNDGSFGRSFEYKNKLGQVILKRVNMFDANKGPSNPNYHDTYYVYDDFGNLTYVLSPEASERIVDINGNLVSNVQQILDDFGYQYKYDHRNRLVEKKIPGKEWEYIIYDVLDRPVLTQDINLRNDNNKWLFTKYDAFGRVAYTGIYTPAAGQTKTTIQQDPELLIPSYVSEERASTPTTIGDTQIYYSNFAYPGANKILKVLTVNYYDDYIDNDGMDFPANVFGQSVMQTAKGLPTVSRVRVLDDSAVYWIWSQTGYDEKGRGIFSSSQNDYFDTLDVSMSDLDFTGKPLETYSVHQRTGFEQIITYDYFTYDHMGRLKTHKQKINNEEVQLIASNGFNELGQLTSKGVGGVTYISGYTDIIDADVDSNGKITKASNTTGWSARVKTKGVIPSLYEGGIDVIVSQNDEMVRLGFVFNGNGGQGNDYYNYGLELRNNGYAYLVLNGTATSTNLGIYNQGDLFRVERLNVGTLAAPIYDIKFMHNNSVIHTISNVGQVESENILTGKVSFSGDPGSVESVHLFGPYLDKKLQSVAYKYNIRGWLTDINDVGSTSKKLEEYNDLFNFRINYNNVQNTGNPEPLYNGNISQTFWKTNNDSKLVNGYNFKYDHLNRIKEGKSLLGADMNGLVLSNTYNLLGITYDKNGNINYLERYGKDSPSAPDALWDQLSYEYSGNQLTKVTDAGTISGFYDGYTASLDDYDYDLNGNMIIDRNKGITSNIVYNHLNLPTSVPFGGGSTGGISYVYDAIGTKLKKTVVEVGNPTIVTEYAGNFMYNDASGQMLLEFFNHPEGYVIPTPAIPGGGGGGSEEESVKGFDDDSGQVTYSQYAYVFQYRDHLGNIRLSYGDSNRDGSIDAGNEIIEESNYYPFGLKQKGYNNVVEGGNDLAQQWKFGGKEYNQELGLNWYDFGARNYNAALGRWMNIDPAADVLESSSQYVYALNSPMIYLDLDGELPILINGRTGNSGRADASYWGTAILNTIKGGGIANPGGELHFVDGNRGWNHYNGRSFASIVAPEAASARKMGGGFAAAADWDIILSKLEKDPESGKIIEKIQIYTHSRGSAFGEGYTEKLLTLIQENSDLFADADNVIDFVLDLAPHQSGKLNAVNGVDTYTIDHDGDSLSDNDKEGAKAAFTTGESSGGVFGAHKISSFNNNLKAFTKAFVSGETSDEVIDSFVQEMQDNYGIEVTIKQ